MSAERKRISRQPAPARCQEIARNRFTLANLELIKARLLKDRQKTLKRLNDIENEILRILRKQDALEGHIEELSPSAQRNDESSSHSEASQAQNSRQTNVDRITGGLLTSVKDR